MDSNVQFRASGDPVNRRLEPHDMRCPREGGVRRPLVASLGIDAQFAPRSLPNKGRVRRQRIGRAGDRGQRLVPHLDPLSRV
jgi:hypothetical protein